jgi:hypothetical protein
MLWRLGLCVFVMHADRDHRLLPKRPTVRDGPNSYPREYFLLLATPYYSPYNLDGARTELVRSPFTA